MWTPGTLVRRKRLSALATPITFALHMPEAVTLRLGIGWMVVCAIAAFRFFDTVRASCSPESMHCEAVSWPWSSEPIPD